MPGLIMILAPRIYPSTFNGGKVADVHVGVLDLSKTAVSLLIIVLASKKFMRDRP